VRAACIAAVALIVGWAVGASARAAGTETIEIVSASGVHPFSVEMASNEAEREHGLMGRKSLPEGHGMLFDFGFPQPTQFWMHNTPLSLDIIFIAPDGHIIRIAESAKPMNDTLIPSGGLVRGVLEVVGGTSRKLGIKAGDKVTGSIFGKGS
jgi:uncharacterized membrane protein (UPF0127 family)